MEKKLLQDATLYTVEKPFHERGQWLFAFYCLAFLIPAIWYMFMIIFVHPDVKSAVIMVVVIIALLIAGYRYASSASRIESIKIDKKTLVITKGNWFRKKHTAYIRDKISQLRYVPKPVLTDHPLAGNGFDYLGFQTQQRVINEMFGDNKIAFDYEGQLISFGKNLYSWDFDELNSLINDQGLQVSAIH